MSGKFITTCASLGVSSKNKKHRNKSLENIIEWENSKFPVRKILLLKEELKKSKY